MKGGHKEHKSEPPLTDNNRHLGKHDHTIEDTNDSTNQNQGTASSTHDNSHTISDVHTTGDYTDHHPTTDNVIYGE